MIISEHHVQIEGHLLHRTIFDPSEGEPSMVGLFSHGQGDFSKRYQDVLHPFTDRGIRCISMDLLGHGLSPGKRGHCGGADFIDEIKAQDFFKNYKNKPGQHNRRCIDSSD